MLFYELYIETLSIYGFATGQFGEGKEIVSRSSVILVVGNNRITGPKCFIVEGLEITKYGEKTNDSCCFKRWEAKNNNFFITQPYVNDVTEFIELHGT